MNEITDFEKEYRAGLNEAVADADIPPALLSQYSFESCLRADGKKELYLLSRKSDSVSALLRITTDYPEEDALAEAELLRSLNHPGIPKVYDSCEYKGRKFLVREYFAGRSLYEAVKSDGVFSETDIYNVAHKLCDILTYLHSQNPPVIHRDIKPQNIIITTDGYIKLIDFGTSRLHKEGQRQDTTIIVTDSYAAPESYGFMQTAQVADIYSLGIVLLFLATGSASIKDIKNVGLSDHLLSLIQKCAAFDPDTRPQSIAEVLELIRGSKNNKPQNNKRKAFITGLSILSLLVVAFIYYFPKPIPAEKTKEIVPSVTSTEPDSEDEIQAADNSSAPTQEKELDFTSTNGNLPGNIANKGYAVLADDRIFFTGKEEIWSMDLNGQNAIPVAKLANAKCLNYYNNTLYCAAPTGIHEIDLETGESYLVLSGRMESFIVHNDRFYFKNMLDELCLYRAELDGSGLEKVNDLSGILYLNLAGNHMVFCDEKTVECFAWRIWTTAQ